MNQNITTKQKLEDFINKIESLGYDVKPYKKKPQYYYIDNKLVNIRCRGKSRVTTYGRSFWYSIVFDILQEAEWVVYITTTPDYFFMFPSEFLMKFKDRMYTDNNKTGVGVFDLDWDNEMIVLKQGSESISNYYHNLKREENYPKF